MITYGLQDLRTHIATTLHWKLVFMPERVFVLCMKLKIPLRATINSFEFINIRK